MEVFKADKSIKGDMTRCRVARLLPATQYTLRVKASVPGPALQKPFPRRLIPMTTSLVD